MDRTRHPAFSFFPFILLLVASCGGSGDRPPRGLTADAHLTSSHLTCAWTANGDTQFRTVPADAAVDVVQEGDTFSGTLEIYAQPMGSEPVSATYALTGRVGSWDAINRWYELHDVVAERTATTEPSPLLFADRMTDEDVHTRGQVQHDGEVFVVARSAPGEVACHADANDTAYLSITLSNSGS